MTTTPFRTRGVRVLMLNRRGVPALSFCVDPGADDSATEARIVSALSAGSVTTRALNWRDSDLHAGWHRVDWARLTTAWPDGRIDQHIDLSGEWVWGVLADTGPFSDAGAVEWAYTRRAGTTTHRRVDFDATEADHRPEMMLGVSDLHSADARADVHIDSLYGVALEMLELRRGDLAAQKDQLRDDDPDVPEAERSRVRDGLHRIGQVVDRLHSERSAHLVHAVRVRLAEALIEGHGPGPMQVEPHVYYTLASRLAALWVADTDTARRVRADNLVTNLSADHDRSEFSRLVPKGPAIDAVDPDALYARAKLTPPQFGATT